MISKLLVILALAGLSTPEAYVATAVATCESGNTITFGTHSWTARSETNDGGAFQFNDATWQMLDAPTTQANDALPIIQTKYFKMLWNNGYGSSNWKASSRCWAKWISTDGIAHDDIHYQWFSRQYSKVIDELVRSSSCKKCS